MDDEFDSFAGPSSRGSDFLEDINESMIMRECMTGNFPIMCSNANTIILHGCKWHESVSGKCAVVHKRRFLRKGMRTMILSKLITHHRLPFPFLILLHRRRFRLLLRRMLLLRRRLLLHLHRLLLLLLLSHCRSSSSLLSLLDNVFRGPTTSFAAGGEICLAGRGGFRSRIVE